MLLCQRIKSTKITTYKYIFFTSPDGVLRFTYKAPRAPLYIFPFTCDKGFFNILVLNRLDGDFSRILLFETIRSFLLDDFLVLFLCFVDLFVTLFLCFVHCLRIRETSLSSGLLAISFFNAFRREDV
jgi:hypothetical protein